jgi:hypothetical protein
MLTRLDANPMTTPTTAKAVNVRHARRLPAHNRMQSNTRTTPISKTVKPRVRVLECPAVLAVKAIEDKTPSRISPTAAVTIQGRCSVRHEPCAKVGLDRPSSQKKLPRVLGSSDSEPTARMMQRELRPSEKLRHRRSVLINLGQRGNGDLRRLARRDDRQSSAAVDEVDARWSKLRPPPIQIGNTQQYQNGRGDEVPT